MRDDLEGFALRATVRLDERTGCCAQAGAPDRIPDERQQRLVKIPIRVHLDGCVVSQEGIGDLLEVLHVGTEYHWLSEDRRLEDVVAAVVDEASAHEHRRGQLIELGQLANLVEHDDVGSRLGIDGQSRTAHAHETRVVGKPFHLAESLRRARRNDQERTRRHRFDSLKGSQDR